MQWLKDFPVDFHEDMKKWASGRLWYLRAPLIAYFLYIFARHLLDDKYSSLFGGLNLGIHELGHYLFAWAGDFLYMAGGTITQCFVPVAAIFMFYRMRDYFAISFCFGWLSTNFFNVATYVSDARDRLLPLVTPGGGEVRHDWFYLLSKMGLLEYDKSLGTAIRVLAVISMLIFLLGGTYILYLFTKKPPPEPVEYKSMMDGG